MENKNLKQTNQTSVVQIEILEPAVALEKHMQAETLFYSAKDDQQYGYSDEYFEPGHWWLKIRQTIIALLSWGCVLVPSFITIESFVNYATHQRHGIGFWRYTEGIHEILFLIFLLAFMASVTFIFAISMTLIQNNRREGTLEKWPTFDSIDDIHKKAMTEQFMERRFAIKAVRHNVRYYEVQPDQNLEDTELADYLHVDRG